MTKNIRVKLLANSDHKFMSNVIMPIPFREYRAGKYSKVFEMQRDWYKMIIRMGFIGYEVVENENVAGKPNALNRLYDSLPEKDKLRR